jgi:hypothetical protein
MAAHPGDRRRSAATGGDRHRCLKERDRPYPYIL